MANYDLNLILNPTLSAEQLETEKNFIASTVQGAGAQITNLDEPGSRRMAYPIQKDREGYYLFYTVTSEGNPEKQIAATLRLRDNVRRVLVVRDRPEWKTKKA